MQKTISPGTASSDQSIPFKEAANLNFSTNSFRSIVFDDLGALAEDASDGSGRFWQ